MTVTFDLHRLMQAHDISAYRLERELEGQLNRNTVYAMTRQNGVKRIDLESLSKIVNVLSALLGRPVQAAELFTVDPEAHTLRRTAAGTHYTGDRETDEVLDDHPDILKRLARRHASSAIATHE